MSILRTCKQVERSDTGCYSVCPAATIEEFHEAISAHEDYEVAELMGWDHWTHVIHVLGEEERYYFACALSWEDYCPGCHEPYDERGAHNDAGYCAACCHVDCDGCALCRDWKGDDSRWRLDTGSDGCDERGLTGTYDEVVADVLHHHGIDDLPEHWSVVPEEE